MNRKPSGVRHAARDRHRVADDRDDDVLEPGRVDRAAEERQRVHAAGLGVDDLGVVVLPAGLVLLRAAVVVDGEQHRARRARRRAEVHRRLAAVRADLEQRSDARRRRAPAVVQREPFVVGHEALRPRARRRAAAGSIGACRLRRAHAADRGTSARCSAFVVTRMRSNSSPVQAHVGVDVVAVVVEVQERARLAGRTRRGSSRSSPSSARSCVEQRLDAVEVARRVMWRTSRQIRGLSTQRPNTSASASTISPSVAYASGPRRAARASG